MPVVIEFDRGRVVCVHAGLSNESCWIGAVLDVGLRAEVTVYYVGYLGHQDPTSFGFRADELRETVLTFDGPMCVVCKVPY